jgi:hypothetical protein
VHRQAYDSAKPKAREVAFSKPMTVSQKPSATGDGVDLRLGMAYAFALLLIRVAQLAAIGWFTGGAEFANDVGMQRTYAADPLQLLLGRSTTFEVFPPLFPVVLWAIHTPLSWLLTQFYSMRATLCVVELLAWPLLWGIIAHAATGRNRHLLAIAYIVAPICWVSTVVMCQDEMISLAVFAGMTLALLKHKSRLAIFLCGVGVVVAKVYFLVPLVGLLGVPRGRTWREWLYDLLVGLAPIAAVYGLQAVLIGRAGVAVETFQEFVIPFEMSVNIWALIYRMASIRPAEARWISAVIALALSMLPLLVSRIRRLETTGQEQIHVIVAMLLWVFFAFFHINAEYFVIVVPGILVALRPVVASVVLIAGLSLPWSVNFFYGVGIGMETGDRGRAPFVRIYQTLTSADPALLHGICVILVAVVTLWLASVLTWARAKPTTVGNPAL